MAIRFEYIVVFISMQLLASAFTNASGSKDEISFGKSELTGQNVKPANSDGDGLQEIEGGPALGYPFINYQEMNKPTGLSEKDTEYTTPNIPESRSDLERLLILHEKQGNEGYLTSNKVEQRIKGTELDRMKLLMKVDKFKSRDREETKISQAEKQTSQTSKTGESRPQQRKPLAARIGELTPKKVEENLEQSVSNNNVNIEQILSGFATKFEKVNIPNSGKMELSHTKSTKDAKFGNEPNLKTDRERMENNYEGERRIAERYEGITKGVVGKNGAGTTRIERLDEGEIGLVGEMIERMNATKGSVQRKNAGEHMIVVGLKGIEKGMRQGLVRDAKEKTGDIESENERKYRSQEQDGLGYRWIKVGGKHVLVKDKEIQNRIIKGGKKFGPDRKEIMTQGERNIFLGVIGIGRKELEEKEGAIAGMMNNVDRPKEMVGGKGALEVKEGKHGVLGVQGKAQGEISERERVASKGIERERQGELRIATNIGNLNERFREEMSVEGNNEKGVWKDKAILSGIKERMMASAMQGETDRRIESVEEGQRMIMREQKENEEQMKKTKKHEEQVKDEMKSEKVAPGMETETQKGWDKWLG